MDEQKKQKYEDYRKKVSDGTPLRDAERAEWLELQKEFGTDKEKDAAKEESKADRPEGQPENPTADERNNAKVANPSPTAGTGRRTRGEGESEETGKEEAPRTTGSTQGRTPERGDKRK